VIPARLDPLDGRTHHGQGSRALRAAGGSGRLRAPYADTHTALAQAIPGLQRFEAARGFATPDGSAVPYQRIAELAFEDMSALQAGFGSEQGQAAVNDIPNFATGGVTIFFAEID
jgi:uncharacterized protein (TIGR02118 family)